MSIEANARRTQWKLDLDIEVRINKDITNTVSNEPIKLNFIYSSYIIIYAMIMLIVVFSQVRSNN